MVREETDIDHIVETGQQYPYVPVLTAPHFTLSVVSLSTVYLSCSQLTRVHIFRPILSRFRAASRRVSGVLLLDRGVEALDSFSADKSCPNSHFGLYATNETYSHCVRQKWNLVADRDNDRIDDSLMFNDWPFPIFLIRNETNATELQDVSFRSHWCSDDNNCFETSASTITVKSGRAVPSSWLPPLMLPKTLRRA